MQTNVAAHHDHDHHHDTNGNKLFGFWVYLMSDCVLFATLFATYAVLSSNSIAGPTGKRFSNCRSCLSKPCCCYLVVLPSVLALSL